MKRVEELDFARVISMFAVILIHVTSTYLSFDSRWMCFGMNLAFILNQVTRFSVPLFILLSGMSLWLAPSPGRWTSFYRRRLVKIGVPYLIWYTVYFFRKFSISPPPPGMFLKGLLVGGSASHLYFVIVLLQFYLLYPVLEKLVLRAPWLTAVTSFLISYVVEKLYVFRSLGLDLIPGWISPYLWILFPTWAFYFVAGMVIADCCLPAMLDFGRRRWSWMLVLTMVFAAVYVLECRMTGDLDAIKPALHCYVLLVLTVSFGLWSVVERMGLLRRGTLFLARHSMTVYFGHVVVLQWLRRWVFFQRGMSGMLLLFVLTAVGAIILAVVIDDVLVVIRHGGRRLVGV